MERTLEQVTRPLEGRGLHSGRPARVLLAPGPPGSGVRFLPPAGSPGAPLAARLEHALAGPRQTVLASAGGRAATVEHLLAALAGLQIHDAEVRLEGGEVPALDGSARPFARELWRCSRPLPGPPRRPGWRVARPVQARRGAARCLLLPGQGLTISCRVKFSHPRVGEQWLRYTQQGPEHFLARLAPARSFGFLAQRQALRSRGLARGASLGNTLVYDPRELLTPGGTRFADEPVRHKVLDALGDLALLGGPLSGELRLVRCSHRLLLSTLWRACAQGALVQHPGPPLEEPANHCEDPT